MEIDIDIAKPFRLAWGELKEAADEALAVLIVTVFIVGAVRRLGK